VVQFYVVNKKASQYFAVCGLATAKLLPVIKPFA